MKTTLITICNKTKDSQKRGKATEIDNIQIKQETNSEIKSWYWK